MLEDNLQQLSALSLLPQIWCAWRASTKACSGHNSQQDSNWSDKGLVHSKTVLVITASKTQVGLTKAGDRWAHLRVREAGSGHAVMVEHMWPAAHVLHSADALSTGCMRQHVLACSTLVCICSRLSNKKIFKIAIMCTWQCY